MRHGVHFRGLLPLAEFCPVQNSLCVQVLRSPILATLLHDTPAAGSAKLCGVVQGMELRNFRRGRHLYSAGRPSRWASAHILLLNSLLRNQNVTGHLFANIITLRDSVDKYGFFSVLSTDDISCVTDYLATM